MDRNRINRKAFNYNFLKQIILRMDFQGVMPIELENVLVEIKPFLKEKGFSRYDEKVNSEINFNINKGMMSEEDPVKDVKNIRIYTFTNEDRGYSLDLSTTFICMKVNITKYISFEEYAHIFIQTASKMQSMVDFFTEKRFGLRKINFCVVNDLQMVSKYFNNKYFMTNSLFDNSNLLVNNKRETLVIEQNKLNLFYCIEQGKIEGNDSFKITVDTDIYRDNTESIREVVYNDDIMAELNDMIFKVYLDSLTDEFISILTSDTDQIPVGMMGVEKNE